MSIWGALLLLAVSQPPDVVQGRLRQMGQMGQMGTSRGLARDFATIQGTAWAAYVVPMAVRSRTSWMDCGILKLSGERPSVSSSELLVLYRLSSGRVTEVKAVPSACRIDTGSETLHFWEGVSSSESLSYLKSLPPSHDVLHAVALHQGREADTILVELAREGAIDVRKDALFWLSQRAGAAAVEAIAHAVNEDPEIEVKKRAVFALSQLPPDEGVPLLIELAESHAVPEVRKQAFFWLGQSDDPRALALFERVLLGKD